MTLQTTVNGLYRELLIAAMLLLLILLVNNIVLYRQSLKERFSLMLLFSVVMCAFEIIWDVFDGHPNLKALTYIGGIGYVLSFVIIGSLFCHYFCDRFGVKIKSTLLKMLLFNVPIAVFFIIAITTPWTRWLFWVDENGIMQEMWAFSVLFYIVLFGYAGSILIIALYFAIFGRSEGPSVVRTAYSMIVFAVLTPVIFWVQVFIMGADSDYIAVSLAIALALTYLATNVSIHSLLESQAQVEAVEADLRIASKIQVDALPPVAPELEEYSEISLRACMKTAREVGGDFYDYFPIDSNRICFLVADVSGKGTPAALFMMTAKTMIKDYALIYGSTAEIFTAVNARLSENNQAGMFATAWIGILDVKTNILQYTNAGHNYPILLQKGKSCEVLKKVHGVFLAGFDDTEYRSSELKLSPGDRLRFCIIRGSSRFALHLQADEGN